MTLLLLLACGGPTDAPDDPLEEWTRGLPPCEPAAESDRLDWEDGCVDGACLGMDYSQINAALEETAECSTFTANDLVYCSWRDGGIRTTFVDTDRDGQPDSEALARGLFLRAPWDGASEKGLAIGVSLSCFVYAFGPPNSAERVQVDGKDTLSVLHYQGVDIDDRTGAGTGEGLPDGYVDRIALGPPEAPSD